MLPIHFGKRDRPLFGLYDEGASPRRRVGVVLCNPIGWEYLRAHRTLRLLAGRLADAGFDVLRFDYSGTGDSWGDIAETATLAQWFDDTEAAIEELCGVSGSSRIALVGLRHGAAIAAEVAQRRPEDVERVVLWDPPCLALDGHDTALASDVPSTVLPQGRLREELAALARRVPHAGRASLVVAVSEEVQHIPAELASVATDLIRAPGSPTCWVEERDFGAGAVPSELLTRIVQGLAE